MVTKHLCNTPCKALPVLNRDKTSVTSMLIKCPMNSSKNCLCFVSDVCNNTNMLFKFKSWL